MINRTTKLRWRRRYRRSRSQVGDISAQAEEHLERHFFRKLSRLFIIRRFLLSWVGLVILLVAITIFQTYDLSSLYQKLAPAPGGTFTEGIVGTYTNANPLFASTPVDTAASRLMFDGLLKYNQQNQLVPDLAQSYTTDDKAETYTVILKPNLKWQDGTPLTAQDVVFTFQTIQNPDVRSPLFSSWQGVTIKALDSKTIQFSLPNSLSSFAYNLTTGIIPQHLLGSISPTELRSVNFDTVSPVGAGPFKIQAIQVRGTTAATRQVQIGFSPNKYYHSGPPKLDHFIISTYNDDKTMVASFRSNDIEAIAGPSSVPPSVINSSSISSYNVPLTAEVMVFFKNSQPILADVKVRQALVEGTNQAKIIAGLGYSVIPAKSPLLPFQVGYEPGILQLPTNIAAAKALLDQDGWVVGKGGIRYKDNSSLTFQLFTQENNDYDYVAQALVQQWRAIGVDAQVVSQQPTDFQTALSSHAYDAVLYGITIGVDPDVFGYWDSSQAAANAIPRLNLSEYKSTAVDQALEGGRTRTDPTLRAIKYRPFLQSWQNDAPALALYQPRFLYVSHLKIYNFDPTMFNSPIDRYSNVSNWMIREVKKTNLL